MVEYLNGQDAIPHHQLSLPVPQQVLEQIEQESMLIGDQSEAIEEYQGAIGRTMFDLPNSEDNTLTVLLPKEHVHDAPSQALLRIHSRREEDHRSYLGIVVQGPFAEPD